MGLSEMYYVLYIGILYVYDINFRFANNQLAVYLDRLTELLHTVLRTYADQPFPFSGVSSATQDERKSYEKLWRGGVSYLLLSATVPSYK